MITLRLGLAAGLLALPAAACFPSYDVDMAAMTAEVDTLLERRAVAPLRVDGPIVLDDGVELAWTSELTEEMTWKEARVYCTKQCRVGGYDDWRLPSYAELTSLIVPEKLVDDTDADTFPFLEPFDKKIFGFVFTGTVLAENEPWVMNRRNGHLFNGARKRAYVRCVRLMEPIPLGGRLDELPPG